MATDFSGTNTERTDKLVVALVELRTTVRLMLAAVSLVGPVMVGILSFLYVQASETNVKLERLYERVDANAARLDRVAEKVDRLSERVEANSAKLDRIAQQADANAVALERIAAQLNRMEKAKKP